MNVFDIITIVIFALFVIICAFKGLLKILSNWGSFFGALIISRIFGAAAGEFLLNALSGPISNMESKTLASLILNAIPTLGTVLLFFLVYLVLRLILGGLAKILKKVFDAKPLDHFLGAIVGVFGGIAVIFLFTFLIEIVGSITSALNINSGMLEAMEGSPILNFFMSLTSFGELSIF